MIQDNAVILWQKDDSLTPNRESIHGAYERITNPQSRFCFLPNGNLRICKSLRDITSGKNPFVRIIQERDAGDEIRCTLSNRLRVIFSGDRCSRIEVPLLPPALNKDNP
jgi:hypothetical protein